MDSEDEAESVALQFYRMRENKEMSDSILCYLLYKHNYRSDLDVVDVSYCVIVLRIDYSGQIKKLTGRQCISFFLFLILNTNLIIFLM